ncbi:hypothetical protein [Nocardia sienata]|uniref:hypothetical protein n=1 Tax=Nocardia sienata TaxID=248552 RepID=UPI0007A416A6|nr:hypothetical protein [Nocardia sienata]
MNALSPWRGITDETLLRLTNLAGRVSKFRSGLIRDYSYHLDVLIEELTTSDRDFELPMEWRSVAEPGARGAVPPSGRFPAYTPSRAEHHVATRRLVIDEELSETLPSSANGIYVTRDQDGVLYVYKPDDLEMYDGLNWLPHVSGQLARREVAGFRIFELLQAPRVPPTALVDGPRGPGMAQLFVPMKASKDVGRYPVLQQQQAAIGHFVAGSHDGNETNFRPAYDGNIESHRPDDDLVIFDLGQSGPESPDPRRGDQDFAIISPFIERWAGEQLDPDLLRTVRAIPPERLGSCLEDLRFSDSAIDNDLDRLEYVQRTGTVTADWQPS